MGSRLMEPDDVTPWDGFSITTKPTTICLNRDNVQSDGIFAKQNPLSYSVPLLLAQLSLSSLIILLTSRLLRPLGQPSMVSQILVFFFFASLSSAQSSCSPTRSSCSPSLSLSVLIDYKAALELSVLIDYTKEEWPLRKMKKRCRDDQTSSRCADEEELEQIFSSEVDVTKGNKDGRGITCLPEVMCRNAELGKLELIWNVHLQPVGPLGNVIKFKDHIGVLMRMSRKFDWTRYWPRVDRDAKEWLWIQLMDKWEIAPKYKKRVLGDISASIFRGKKAKWKRKHYTPYAPFATDDERNKECPKGLLSKEWDALVHFWDTEEHKEVSARNKISRSFQPFNHGTGRISHAQIIHELTKNDTPLKRAEVFIETHTNKKTKHPVDEQSTIIIEKIKLAAGTDENGFELQLSDEDFVELMPPERPGRPRGYGSGVTHSTIYGSRENESNEVEALKQQLLNAQKEKNEEVEKIKEEMQDKYLEMQEKYDRMQAKYDEIQSRYEDTTMEMISMRKIFESFNQGLNTSNNPFVKKGHIKELHTKSPVISRSVEGVRRVTSSLPIFDSQHITEKDGNFELPRCKVIDPLDPLRVVAEGRLSSTNPNDYVHGVRLGPDGVRVFIDKVLVPKAPLWRPSTEMMYIEEAKNSTVAWPREHVRMNEI